MQSTHYGILYYSICTIKIPYSFTYMWNLKSKINEQRKEKETHKERDQTDGCQRRKVEGLGEKGEEIEKYKLVVTN